MLLDLNLLRWMDNSLDSLAWVKAFPSTHVSTGYTYFKDGELDRYKTACTSHHCRYQPIQTSVVLRGASIMFQRALYEIFLAWYAFNLIYLKDENEISKWILLREEQDRSVLALLYIVVATLKINTCKYSHLTAARLGPVSKPSRAKILKQSIKAATKYNFTTI